MKTLFNQHIDLRFLFTPFAKTMWTFREGTGMTAEYKTVHMYYMFGIRVARIHVSNP